MRKHYSTAQKIIDRITAKIAFKLRALKWDRLFLKGNRYLAEILGDVLKEKIPDRLYKRYQNLDEKGKKEFRETIANQYFISIESLTEQFKKVDVRWETYKQSKWDDEEDHAYIILPSAFTNKEQIFKMLSSAITAVQQMLLCEDEIIKFQNSL